MVDPKIFSNLFLLIMVQSHSIVILLLKNDAMIAPAEVPATRSIVNIFSYNTF